jgi:hypothetical protein
MRYFLSIYFATLVPMILVYYIVFPAIGRLLDLFYVRREPLPPLPALIFGHSPTDLHGR